MNRIFSLLLIVFSLFSTACITPVRPVVVIGQPGVVYRAPTQNARGNTVTVTVSNYIAGADLDVKAGGTVVIPSLKSGDTKEVSFACSQGLITFSVGGARRQTGSTTQVALSATAHKDSVARGVAKGAPKVTLNCNNRQSRPMHQSVRWEVRKIEPLTELPSDPADTV